MIYLFINPINYIFLLKKINKKVQYYCSINFWKKDIKYSSTKYLI